MRHIVFGHWVINWCWFGEIVFNKETCTAELLYWDRSKNPPEMEYGDVIEQEGRIITGVKIGKEVFVISNPKHVFSYPLND